jgi:predicted XRE-type DNA-binding protein
VKRKNGAVVTRSAIELASALGLTPTDAVEIEVRSALNDKIVEIVAKHGLTHAQVAKIAETSRTRMTAILNRNTQDVSTDLLLRILARLGYRVKIRFSKAA